MNSDQDLSTVVLLVMDTLNRNYIRFCRRLGAKLPNLERIERLCPINQDMVCGSFPTVPMRTDLLTGTLAFLDRRWACPKADDIVFTRFLFDNGVRTFLVTDNYILFEPQLQARLDKFFDTVRLIRGSGSDPWAPMTAKVPLRPASRPARNVQFEKQYLCNALAWSAAGGTPWRRLALEACRGLDHLNGKRALVWIDCFSCHEPWADPEKVFADSSAFHEPISPPYGEISEYSDSDLVSIRRQYSSRLKEVDQALGPLADRLEGLMASGDIGLLMLSDHGFLFGEFGLVGKPKEPPVLPPLHELVCRASSHFGKVLNAGTRIQPHDLTSVLIQMFGLPCAWTASRGSREEIPLVIGRNSPPVQAIVVRLPSGLLVIPRNHAHFPLKWIAETDLRPERGWLSQGTEVSATVEADIQGINDVLRGRRWTRQFTCALEELGLLGLV